MASREVRMNILASGGEKAKATLDDLAERARALGAEDPTITPSVNDDKASAKLKDLKLKLDILKHYEAEAEVGVNDDKAQAKLLGIKTKLHELGALDTKTSISLSDADKVEAQLVKLKLMLDEVAKDRTVRLKIREETDKRSIGLGALGGRMELAGTKDQSLLARLLGIPSKGGNGNIGGENAAAGLLNGSPGQALTTPEIAGPALGLGAGLLPSLTGFAGGLGVAGLGGVLSYLFATQSATAITADQKAVTAATTAQQKKAAQSQLSQDTSAFAPFINLQAGIKNLEQPLEKAVAPFATGLTKILGVFGAWLTKVGPMLAKMFSDSLPFANAFIHFLEQGAMQLFPALMDVMKEIQPQLPEMVYGFVLIVKALAEFIRLMGPEMKDSVVIFVAFCKGLVGVMNVLGVAVDYVTGALKLAGDWLRMVAKVIGDLFTGNVNAAWRAIKQFGHDVAGTFDNLRHVVSEALDNMGLAAFGHSCARIFDNIRHDVSSAWDALWHYVVHDSMSALESASKALNAFDHAIAHVFDDIRHTVAQIWDSFWSWWGHRLDQAFSYFFQLSPGFKHGVANLFDGIRHDVSVIWDDMWNWVGDRLVSAKNDELHKLDDLRHGISTGFDNIRHDVSTIWDDIWSGIESRTSQAISRLGSILNRIEGAFNKPFAWIGDHVLHPLSNVWNWIAGHTGNVLPKMPNIFNLADGGFVSYGSGPRADDVPAMLSRGEVVVPAHMVSGGAVDHLRGALPGFANGGSVGNSGDNPSRGISGRFGGNPTGGAPGWLKSIGSAIGGGLGELGSFITGIPSDLGGIGKAIASGAAGTASRAAEALINGTLGKTPAMMTGAARATGDLLIGRMAGAMATAVNSVSGNGSSLVKYAEKFVGKLPYVWGGTSLTSGADCSGFVKAIYQHFGYSIPRTSEEQYAGMTKVTSPAAGDLVFFAGSDGTRSAPGHVGMYTGFGGNRAMIDEPYTGQDARYDNIAGNLGFRGPRGGFKGGGGGPVGAGYVNIGRALMNEGFTRAAAAGIVGCIAGESGGSPESVGSGGGGLIGWTPVTSAYPVKDIITGNRNVDMGHQIEDIKAYVERNGSMGDMNRYKDALQAAYHFSEKYERPAVTFGDVRAGVARSTYAALDNGIGWLAPGINMIYNGLGHMEPMADPSRYPARFGGGGPGSGGDTYNIYVSGMIDNDSAAENVVKAINKRARHHGNKTGLIQG